MGDAEDTKPRSFVFTKSKAKVRIDAGGVEEQQEHRQLIVGLQGSVVQPANLEAGTAPKRTVPTIAPLANTFKTGVGNKFTPSFRPPSSDAAAAGDPNEKFELAAVDSRPLITEFGLAKRTKPGSNGQNTTEQTSELAARRVKGSTELELLAFKRDMEQLPDAAGEQAYENMPIADFGRAMLMGMGWHEGMGVGRNRKPIEYLRRPDRLGLGAKPVPVVNDGKPKVVKMGGSEVQRQDLVLPPSANGRQRHVRHLDEQLVQRSETEPGPRPGKAMRVTGGKHAGLACQVIALLPQREGHSCRASVKLMPSHELVEVRCKDLDEPHSNQQQQQQARDKRPATHGAFPAAEHRKKRARSDGSSDSESEEAAAGARMWLTSFIKVRIIDKKLGGGKLYLKKGTVVDVHPGGRCDVSVDDTQHVLHVKQSALETVVPRDVGASVLIVSGPLRGNKARLHAKSAGGAAAVQLVSDFSVHHLMLDDIAMFVGSMEDE
ncbi:DExH-box splicing factor binding site-domain-containing protein [Haematococcus lacustris]